MTEVFDAILNHMHDGAPCVLVSAVGGEGSVPRRDKAHMLVNTDGRVCGTVGGGAVEFESIAHAQRLLSKRESDCRQFELYEHAGDDIGMVCGGRVHVHFRFVAPDDAQMAEVVSRLLALAQMNMPAWLILGLDAGGITLYTQEKQFGAPVPNAVLEGLCAHAAVLSVDEHRYYTEKILTTGRVYIFGGGHVAQALVPVLSAVDFKCVVIEDRAELCAKALFPKAEEVLYMQAGEWAQRLHISEEDAICIMTRGHEHDLDCQAFALGTEAGYIGVIGSRRKVEFTNARLREMGFSDETIQRTHSPIGLDIGAVTPAEIAVSIAAQMIAHRAQSRKTPVKKRGCQAKP